MLRGEHLELNVDWALVERYLAKANVFFKLSSLVEVRSGLVSGSSSLGSRLGRGHGFVVLGKTFYSHSASLHPGV